MEKHLATVGRWERKGLAVRLEVFALPVRIRFQIETIPKTESIESVRVDLVAGASENKMPKIFGTFFITFNNNNTMFTTITKNHFSHLTTHRERRVRRQIRAGVRPRRGFACTRGRFAFLGFGLGFGEERG